MGRTEPTAAKTVAMTVASYRRKTTGVEHRPRGQPLLDRSGQSAHYYGSDAQVTRSGWSGGSGSAGSHRVAERHAGTVDLPSL